MYELTLKILPNVSKRRRNKVLKTPHKELGNNQYTLFFNSKEERDVYIVTHCKRGVIGTL